MRLLLQLLPQTGLRLNEALQLKVADIDFERGWIRVRAETTKNKKAREVPLIPELKDAIQSYLKNRKVDSPYLFPNEKDPNKPMREKYVYDNLHSLLKRLGLDRRDPSGVGYLIHPHVFRKWFKTQLEGAGVNPLLVERWMGHKRGIEAIYYLPNKEMIQEAVEKAAEALKIFGKLGVSRKELIERLERLERRYAEDEAFNLMLLENEILKVMIFHPEKKNDKNLKTKLKQIRDELKRYKSMIDPDRWNELEELASTFKLPELIYDYRQEQRRRRLRKLAGLES